jgi:hypothetical protein
MAEKSIKKITIDVESDWGGRTTSLQGIYEGLPLILSELRKNNKKALFFISTEITRDIKGFIKQILTEGHEIGSHGHLHIKFKDRWRAEEDRRISNTILIGTVGILPRYYRAPKFNHLRDVSIYSNPANHTGLLKALWLRSQLKENSIFYMHPFDIVEPDTKAPNLFCKAWYSRPLKARSLFEKIVKVI